MGRICGEDILKPSEVARALGLSGRTVIGWMNSGLLRHHRIPQSLDSREHRRVYRQDVIAFVRHHMPTAWLALRNLGAEPGGVLLVGVPPDLAEAAEAAMALRGSAVARAGGLLEAGMVLSRSAPTVLAVDVSVGRTEALQAAAQARELFPDAALVALAHEDEDEGGVGRLREAGYASVLVRPFHPGEFAELLLELTAERPSGVFSRKA